MKQYETRSEYMDAIARALGLKDRDALSYPHHDLLSVENFSRLAPILDMIEIAAGQHDFAPTAEDGELMADTLIAIVKVLEGHRDSKVKAVQAMIEEIDAVLYDKEGENADLS